MATVDDVYNIAVLFLDAAAGALSLTDEGAPLRRFVADGQPALDCCGQLAVWTQTLDDYDTRSPLGGLGLAKRPVTLGTVPRATVFVQATRCALYMNQIGGDQPPDASLIQQTARIVDQDGWALRLHMDRELREGELANICAGAEALGGQKITPQGGCVGWTFSYRYPLEPGSLGT